MNTIQEIQAIEALERLRVQMLGLVETGVFGPHKPDGCLICPANRIIDDLEDLMEKMQPDTTKQENVRDQTVGALPVREA